jgi:ABC-2 type transport system permease protein
MTAFLLLNGYIFWLILSAYSRPGAPSGSVMQVFLARNVFFWFIVLLFVPAITMRLFAEERRSGTLEVLMSAPLTDTEAVLGKYLGAFAFYAALWAPTLVYVAILRRFTAIDPGPIGSGYLFVVMIGAMFLTLGLLVSILTKSQIVAAIVAFVLMFLLFTGPIFLEGIAPGTPLLQTTLSTMNLWNHAGDFSKGIVDTRYLVYYTTASLVFLFLSVRALGAMRGR